MRGFRHTGAACRWQTEAFQVISVDRREFSPHCSARNSVIPHDFLEKEGFAEGRGKWPRTSA